MKESALNINLQVDQYFKEKFQRKSKIIQKLEIINEKISEEKEELNSNNQKYKSSPQKQKQKIIEFIDPKVPMEVAGLSNMGNTCYQ